MKFPGKQRIRIRVASLLIRDSRMLLVAHKKDGRVYWLLPGGGVGFGESLPEALRREIREELGVMIDVGDAAFFCDSIEPRKERHILHVFFHCSMVSGELCLGSDRRLYDFRFFSAQEIEGITVFPSVKDDILAIMKGGRPGLAYRPADWIPL